MFHRFRIGALQATVVSNGPLSLPSAAMIFKGPKASSLGIALTEAGLPGDLVRFEQNCLLLETGGWRALFDNGLGSRKLHGRDGAS